MNKRFFVLILVCLVSLGLVSIALAAADSVTASIDKPNPERINTTQKIDPVPIDPKFMDRWVDRAYRPSSSTGTGAWDSDWVGAPAIISDSGQLRMWYTGGGPSGYGIGEASSLDGINWAKSPLNPVLTPGLEAAVFKEGPADYKIWFHTDGTAIYRAISSDGLAWTVDPAPAFEPSGQEGTFDRDGVEDPLVILDDNDTYWMFYTGFNNDIGIAQIGAATSPDGLTWTRVQTDPVLPPGDPGDWDEIHTLDPMVILDGGTFKMWYSSFDSNNIRRIGYATSTNGVDWTKYAGNPVFEPDPGQWDDGIVGNHAVLFDGDYQMWYTSNGRIGYVTSTDGIDWTRSLTMPVLLPGSQLYINVNYAHDWVGAITDPYASVVITLTDAGGIKATVSGPAGESGWFSTDDGTWYPERPDIVPGDTVIAAAAGLTTTVDPIGAIEGRLDFDADTVAGSIHAPWFTPITLTVRCEIWIENAPPPIDITGVEADGGSYTCDFASVGWDLQPGQMVAVIYYEPDGDLVVNIIENPWMRVNYAHDWVGGNYPPDHTFWITVTDSLGEFKATAQLDSTPGGGWSGDGFETQWQQWAPQQPDIEPGDWVTFHSDDGYENVIQVGGIQGDIDLANDSVSGPIYADWFTEPLNVECHPWGAPGGAPVKNSSAAPDGSSPYTCQWDPVTEWDVLPGQDVAVMYIEPDGDRVINVFRDPAPDMRIEKWSEGSGQVMPGGPVVFTLQYRNDGDADAVSFTITDTLPANTTYFTDTSGVTPQFGPDWVSWTLGPLEPGYESHFQLVLDNTAEPGDTLTNAAEITAMYDFNDWNDHAEAQVTVVDAYPDLYVNKNPNPGDPVPGGTFLYEIHYGNNGPVASGPVFLTDTLPADTSIVSWYSDNGNQLWSDASTSDDQLLLTAPSIPGNWGDRIILRLQIDPEVSVGTQLTNTVEINTANDTNPDNDSFVNRDAWTGEPRWDGNIDKSFSYGILVPGGHIVYHVFLHNYGNMPAQTWITDTLPEGTIFREAWYWDGQNSVPFPPDSIDESIVAWDMGELQPGEWFDFDLQLYIDPTLPPGTEITNCAEITLEGPESNLDDNNACVIDAVQQFGPNLRVQKSTWWEGYERLAYELLVQNIGTLPLENIWITDTYPVSTTFNGDWWNESGHSITLTHNEPAQQLIFRAESVDERDTIRIRFNVDLDQEVIGVQGLSFTNLLDAPFPGDVYPSDNHDQVTAYTGPDVYIEKWLSAGVPEPGRLLTYTVGFGNSNQWPWDGDPNYGSHITETLPEGMTFITATAPWDPSQPWVPELVEGNTVVWGWGTMWNNSRWEFDLVVQLDESVQGGDVLTNVIEAYGDSPYDVEPDWENNVFELPLTVLAPMFEVSKTFESSQVAGMPVTYDLSLANIGNQTATGVVLVDAVPEGITFGGSDGSFAGGQVLWDIASLAPDSTAAGWFTGTLTCQAGEEISNEEYYVAGSDQGVVAPNGPPVTFTTTEPDIQTAIQTSSTAIGVGESVTFSATASTDGTALDLAWDFGDGGTGVSSQVSHTYTAPGSFEVELTAVDGCGYSATETVTILVSPRGVYLPLMLNLHPAP